MIRLSQASAGLVSRLSINLRGKSRCCIILITFIVKICLATMGCGGDSGYSAPSRALALSLGAAACLTKPLAEQKVLEAVACALGNE